MCRGAGAHALGGLVLATAILAGWSRPAWSAPAAARFEGRPLAGRAVVVDPGHGGIDSGCVAGGFYEKDVVLPIGLQLARLLRAAGARAGLTRIQDMELGHMRAGPGSRYRRDLATRVAVSRRLGPDAYVSLHANSSRDAGMSGVMTFYAPNRPEGRVLALRLLEALRPVMPGNQNAALPGDLYVLRTNPFPAVLVELGFLTHPRDRAVLTSLEGQKRLADALFSGVTSYLTGPDGGGIDEPPELREQPLPSRLSPRSGAPSGTLAQPSALRLLPAAPEAGPDPVPAVRTSVDPAFCPHHEDS